MKNVIVTPERQLPLFHHDSKPLASIPSPNTLASVCLRQLLNGHSLTHPSFERISGSWRLSAIVHKLRSMGWPIQGANLKPYRRGTRPIRVYWLPNGCRGAIRGKS